VIVFNYFLDRTPELLNHFRHVLGLLANLMFHVLKLLLFLELLLLELLLASSCLLLRIANLLLGFSLEVLCHPFHFLNKEVPMVFLLGLLSRGRCSLRWGPKAKS